MCFESSSPQFNRLVATGHGLEKIADGHIFTEGPVWDSRDQSLMYVDIIGDTIWNWKAEKGKRLVRSPSGKVNGLTYDTQGRLLMAGWTSRTITRMDSDGNITVLASHFQGKKLNNPNDIVTQTDGTILFTDPAGGLSYVAMGGDDLQQYLDFSGVYRLNPESGALALLTDEVPHCNGFSFFHLTNLVCISVTQLEGT